jgi:hypothetical protein
MSGSCPDLLSRALLAPPAGGQGAPLFQRQTRMNAGFRTGIRTERGGGTVQAGSCACRDYPSGAVHDLLVGPLRASCATGS